jgi:ATP-binding cassette, subfamily C (CFTR/MRP), member 1
LLLALFRIIEPVEGSIYIDGVDITSIGLHDCKDSKLPLCEHFS